MIFTKTEYSRFQYYDFYTKTEFSQFSSKFLFYRYVVADSAIYKFKLK